MKQRILIAVYNMEIGGIERSLLNLLESLDYDRFEVDVLVYHHTGELMPFICEKANLIPEIPAYTVFRKSIVQCIREGQFPAVFVRLLSKLRAGFYAWRHKFTEGSGYVQMQWTMKYGCRFVPKLPGHYDLAISYAWPHDVVVHCVEAKRKVAWIHTDYSKLEIDYAMDLEVWQQFDDIAAVSEECKKTFLSVYPSLSSRVTVVENIMSPELVRTMAAEHVDILPNPNHSPFYIVSVGRLSYVKGFDMAVRALKRLHDKGYTHMKWLVVGYGGFESEIRDLIKECGLEDSFILLGKKLNPYPYMRLCDIYVQPSRYEGKAVTVTEAQMLAKPVLITNYPTAPSQVTPEVDGMICECSVEGLVKGIEQLYVDEVLRQKLISQLKMRSFSNVEELDKLYAMVSYPDSQGDVAI